MFKNTFLPGQLSMVASVGIEHLRDMCPCIVFLINFFKENIANEFVATVYLW